MSSEETNMFFANFTEVALQYLVFPCNWVVSKQTLVLFSVKVAVIATSY